MNIAQHFSIAFFITSITLFILALFVYFKNRQKIINRTFVFYTLCAAFWSLGHGFHVMATTKSEALFWARFMHFGIVFISTGFLHFTLSLLDLNRLKRRLIISLYCVSFVFLFLTFTKPFIPDVAFVPPINYHFKIGYIYPFFLAFWIGSVTYGLLLLFRGYRSSTSVRRNQLKFLFWATLAGFIGGSTNYIPAFGYFFYPLNPFLTYTVPIYSCIVAYTITRYRLMDIRLIFKRTMVYSLSAGLLMAFFVIIVLSITKFLSAYTEKSSFAISIFAALIIAFLFNPLRNKMQIIVDKILYKKTYDYYDTIQKVSHDLVSMFDVNSIYSFIGDIVVSSIGLKHIYLLSATPGGDYEVVYSKPFKKGKDKAGGGKKGKQEEDDDTGVNIQDEQEVFKLGRNSDIVKYVQTSGTIMIMLELPGIVESIGQERINKITSDLILFDGEAAVPIFIDKKLELIMILGEKLSGDYFSDEDIKLLDTISNQSSIAIKNAKLYTEKLSSDRLASIGMMSATFAHEIRNPLTSIKTFAQLIPEKYTDTEFRETFSKIVIDEIGRIDGLIEELLSFSSKEALPREQDLDITALMDDSLENLKGRLELEKRNISVEKIYKKDKINISGDLKKLKQVFVNIVNNGCQAMDENGILKVNILSNDKFVDVIIADSGKGISPQELTKIFDPFYTTRPMGVGLGLAISKKIIEDHNGKIEVESKLSEGTTFTISLPIGKN